MKKIVLIISLLIFILISCTQVFTPKPRGYFRITFPEREYQNLKGNYPYKFEHPTYSNIKPDKSRIAQPYWIDVAFPQFKARLHISYQKLQGNADDFYEDCRDLAYKHTIKADAINEKMFVDKRKKVYGILYDIRGNAASSMQFFLTDSIENYLRGALYFNVHPNKDSLKPVIDFLSDDIIHLIETFEWQ